MATILMHKITIIFLVSAFKDVIYKQKEGVLNRCMIKLDSVKKNHAWFRVFIESCKGRSN